MSCTAVYLHRPPSGPWRWGARKLGAVDAVDAGSACALCAREARQPILPSDPPRLAAAYCRGVLLDEQARIFRSYRCHGDPLVLLVAEAESRRCRADAAWAGWDADYAFGGPEELASIAGLPTEALDDPLPTTLADRIAPTLPIRRWDPAANVAIYDAEEPWAGEWLDAASLLSVVAPDGRARDHAFRTERVLSLLSMGPPLLDALEPHPPALPLDEPWLRSGVTIDGPARTIAHWGPARLPRRWLDAIEARWPGWTIVRERELYLGQLARTGRRAHGRRYEDLDPEALTRHLTPAQRRSLGRPGEGPAPADRRPVELRFER